MRQTVLLVTTDGFVRYAAMDTTYDTRAYAVHGRVRAFVRRGEARTSYVIYEERPATQEAAPHD